MRSVGARSAISVLVQTEGTPFGVLCATSLQLRAFTQDDVNFLQSVANVLTAAITGIMRRNGSGGLRERRRRQSREERIPLAHES